MQIDQFLTQNSWLIALSLLTLPIKAYALWQASRLSQKIWFIVLFVSSTFGVIDLLYILLVARKYKVETTETAVQ
jgi:hypothetical protein